MPTAIQFGDINTSNLPWKDQNQHLVIILVDLACPGTKDLLQNADQLLYNRVRWLVLHSTKEKAWKDCNEYKVLDRLPLFISNELFYFCTDPITNRHLVRQQYRLSVTKPTELITEVFGVWEPTQGVVLAAGHGSLITSMRRQNFNQFQLRASIVILHNETLNHLDDLHDKHIDTISRVNYQLTKVIAQALNATVSFTFVDSWGYRDPNTGRYNGMIGELQSDLADLGGTAMFFTQDRIHIIDYLSMTTPTRVKFVFRAPKLSFTDNVFVLPFDQPVWYCTISFILLSGVLLAVVLRTEQRYAIGSDGTGPPARLSDALLNVFGTTCQQGSFIEPKTPPSRCLILLCLVVLMFLYASYSANIVALIQSPSTKIQTLDDLLASRLKTGAEDTVYNRYYFQHQTEPIRKALYERKMRNRDGTENFLPLAEGVEAIRQGHYAFNVELGVCYKLISETFQEEEKCGLQELEYLKVIDPYYAVQKNSSFREPIRITLFKLREFGIQGRENTLLYTKKPRCTGGSSFIPVSIVDVWPALMTLGWGYLLTVCLLIAEQLWFRTRGRLLPTDVYFQH
ncbi:ionotropic receptor 75a-like [Anopheles ziemanni]|uniref:ionotropic receptor 75a-like n=1 Tax=Anopheles coustani TaxID=139045 RepID=UPI0026588119|nr:ionotropic receptor 75a-like [Anopheles coustani]XP_058178793.1 ionotropic receptor 75a-like [Anopheles ziemanni]